MPHSLFVVATPIGNLKDITLRALEVLREVSLVACEDTRRTRQLLTHYGISKPLLSFHEHNEKARIPELLSHLRQGEDVALVSDAGTPLVSDPGYRLVAATLEAGLPVVPIPGPCAFVAALSASALPPDSLYFGGFLPPKPGARRRVLQQAAGLEATLLFFEAPHRLLEALDDVAAVLGDRRLVVARELTKTFEEFLRGTAAQVREQLAARPAVKGEITILIERGAPRPAAAVPGELATAVEQAQAQGLTRREAIKQVARTHGTPRRVVYAAVLNRPRPGERTRTGAPGDGTR